MRWVGHVALIGKMRNSHKILVENPEGKRPLGRPKLNWKDYIRIDRRVIGCDVVGWIHLVQDRDQWRIVVETTVKFRVPLQRGNFLSN
jgi:hypothetical protein